MKQYKERIEKLNAEKKEPLGNQNGGWEEVGLIDEKPDIKIKEVLHLRPKHSCPHIMKAPKNSMILFMFASWLYWKVAQWSLEMWDVMSDVLRPLQNKECFIAAWGGCVIDLLIMIRRVWFELTSFPISTTFLLNATHVGTYCNKQWCGYKHNADQHIRYFFVLFLNAPRKHRAVNIILLRKSWLRGIEAQVIG